MEIINQLGLTADMFAGGSGQLNFWSTPLGIAVLLAIMISSLVNIFHHGIRDDLVTRIFCWNNVITCWAGFIHIFDDTPPQNQMKLLMVGVALKMIWTTYVRVKRYREGRPVHHQQ